MWIARDKNGDLNIFEDKPIKYEQVGEWANKESLYIKYVELNVDCDGLFSDIKWEDEEPTELILNKQL